MIAFGPVPSRRLGSSLGINNIPPKVCTYSCVYCQVGPTRGKEVNRRPFYEPHAIRRQVKERLEAVTSRGHRVDYFTFVPDGEPTLDINLGRELELLREFGKPLAVISNSSLIDRADVQGDLMRADWVSVKVDSTREALWRRINRPHPSLRLASLLDGLLSFAGSFSGQLVTETMLVQGMNDDAESLEELARFLALVRPSKVYLSVPTRPPADRGVRAPDEQGITRAYSLLSRHVDVVECLIGYEGDAFAFGGSIEEDLLGVTAVHPMRESAVRELLERAGAQWSVMERLLVSGSIIETEYGGSRYYLRQIEKLDTGPEDGRIGHTARGN